MCVVLACAHLTCVGLCDIYSPRLTVAGEYWMHRVELDFYYLERGRTYDPSHAGVVRGEVLRIGWTDEVIVVQLYLGPGPEPPDWVVIDVKAETTSGPLLQKDWDALRGRDPVLKDIEIHLAAEAWKLLGDAWRRVESPRRRHRFESAPSG